MTPFGVRVRALRAERSISLRTMAKDIGVSAAYLSALERGQRGRPSWYLVQRVIAYFNVIWDDAEDLADIARRSHPKVTINTAGFSLNKIEFVQDLAGALPRLDDDTIAKLQAALKKI
jgi:transcriptional regulator with XRE-family HTH domain